MKIVKVLGSGCRKCEKTADIIQEVARAQDISVELEKVSDPQVIMRYGVMRTPAVVVDEQLVHSGSVPRPQDVAQWLTGS